jgi:UDP-N-acetylmuramate--alanine ligase
MTTSTLPSDLAVHNPVALHAPPKAATSDSPDRPAPLLGEHPAADSPPPGTPYPLAGKHLYFVGIGGCGMSGLAKMARQHGAACSGSDSTPTSVTESLQRDGIPVSLEQSPATVPQPCDLMVISAAVRPDHPQVLEARRRGLRVLKYAQMLGQMMIGRTGIAVAGTHGKSTTTAMLCHAMIHAGLDPSFILGATCEQIGGGSRCGRSDLLVAEACEFDRSFHNFHPTHALILNVEEDHLDVYSSIDAIVEAFAVFARKVPPHGTLLINHEMAHRLAITAGLTCQIETIGFAPQADWRVELHRGEPAGNPPQSHASTHRPNDTTPPLVRLFRRGAPVAQWPAAIPGEHMAYNAAAAAVTAHRLGAPWEAIAQAMPTFRGVDRRMQWLGTLKVANGRGRPASVTVVDDYGHHPTEIDTTLRALRFHYQPKRLVCVFQPHQHSRTRFLLEQFATSFQAADIVIVPHIYFVRDSEMERHAVSAADLVDRLRQRGKQAMHLYPFDAIVEQLRVIARAGDLVVTMGAGDVWKVARDFLAGG